jgi:aminoglycoside phosphotransferase (APT) family kinase protein
LATFAIALHSLDASDGPHQQPGWRGAPLIHIDPHVRRVLPRLAEVDDGFDLAAAEAAWDICVAAPEWAESPVWIHGDLQPGNLIVDGGRLAAVIDFGGLGVGDPAPDLAPALWTFTGAARTAYREALGYDHATWLRACGWVLGPALAGVDYYRESFPEMAQFGRSTIAAVIAELVLEHATVREVPFAVAREALGVRAGGWAGLVAFEEHPVLLEVWRDLGARVRGSLDEAA